MRVTLKPAITHADWRFTLRARNQNRHRFTNSAPLSWTKHRKYLEQQQHNPKFKLWIIIADGKPVGFLKLNNIDLATVLLKKYQRGGIGSRALALGIRHCKKRGMRKLGGLIKIPNTSSLALYTKHGYKTTHFYVERSLRR